MLCKNVDSVLDSVTGERRRVRGNDVTNVDTV